MSDKLPWRSRGLFTAVNAFAQSRNRRLVDRTLRTEPNPGRFPSIAFPLCANDKFMWRKIFDRNPDFTMLSDKLACKDWVAARAPGLGIARVLWRGSKPEEIPRRVLRGPAMLKTNHSCGTNLAIQNGRPRPKKIRRIAERFLTRDHGQPDLQWGYFDIPTQLFAEELLAAGAPLQELKFYTFGRRIERLVHIHDRFGTMAANVREPDETGTLQLLERKTTITDHKLAIDLPACIDRAERIARDLGAPFDHVRVDLLTNGTELWLGEMTVYNQGGHIGSSGHDPDAQISRAWDIRRSWFLTTPQPGWRGIYARALRQALDTAARDAPPLPPA